MRIMHPGLLTASLSSALLVSACSGSSDPIGTGRVSLGVSDGPVHDAERVCITFGSVEFKSNSQTTVVELEPPKTINLLDFQGADSAPLLIGQELPAGDYQWIRLGVDAVRGSTDSGDGDTGGSDGTECDGAGSYIVFDSGESAGGMHNLYVPSGENNGLKLNRGFTMPVNGSANFTAEFDLMKSVTAPNGLSPDVLLRPTIRLVDNVEVGTLTGTVSNELAGPGVCNNPSIFVFNDGVTPNPMNDVDPNPDNDVEDDPTDPVATAMPRMGDNGYEYTVGYLLAGEYEVAFTCDPESLEPAERTFEPTDGKRATIAPGAIETVDFP